MYNTLFISRYRQIPSFMLYITWCVCVCVCVCVRVYQSVTCIQLFATPWICSPTGHLSMESFRQENLGGLPFPYPGHLPNPEIKPSRPHCRQILISEPPGKPTLHDILCYIIQSRSSNHCTQEHLLPSLKVLPIYENYLSKHDLYQNKLYTDSSYHENEIHP